MTPNLPELYVDARESAADAAADFIQQIIDALPDCPTCKGLGCTCPGFCERADDHVCPDCMDGKMSVFRALAIARAVMTKPNAMVPIGYSEYDSGHCIGMNRQLRELRAVKP